jgi:hypothetical protein
VHLSASGARDRDPGAFEKLGVDSPFDLLRRLL